MANFANETAIASTTKIPLVAKVIVTAFMAVLIPVYWHTYGLTNFVWFCDAALILTAIGMWLESPLLISICSVGILLPQCLWLVDFGSNFVGLRLLGMTSYMFDSKLPIFTRGLSLFHGWLPVLLLWLTRRLGYDRRGLVGWTALAAGLVLICYLFTPPAGTYPSDPNIPTNINYVFGLNDQESQSWMNPHLYVVLWFSVMWLVAYLPTHLVLRKVFAPPQPVAATAYSKLLT